MWPPLREVGEPVRGPRPGHAGFCLVGWAPFWGSPGRRPGSPTAAQPTSDNCGGPGPAAGSGPAPTRTAGCSCPTAPWPPPRRGTAPYHTRQRRCPRNGWRPAGGPGSPRHGRGPRWPSPGAAPGSAAPAPGTGSWAPGPGRPLLPPEDGAEAAAAPDLEASVGAQRWPRPPRRPLGCPKQRDPPALGPAGPIGAAASPPRCPGLRRPVPAGPPAAPSFQAVRAPAAVPPAPGSCVSWASGSGGRAPGASA